MPHRCRTTLGLTLAWLLSAAAIADEPKGPGALLQALELGVPDIQRAVDFYTATLGFEVLSKSDDTAELGNGDARLALITTQMPIAAGDSARAYANFSVGDLTTAAARIREAGGRVEEPFDSAVGRAQRYFDPFGHPGHIIDHPWDDTAPPSSPMVFNVALAVRSIEATEAFLTKLGFRVETRDYLPQTLVFTTRGTAQIILHPSAETEADPQTNAGALRVLADLQQLGEGFYPAGATEVRGPSGNLVKVSTGSTSPTPAAGTRPGARDE